MIVLVHASPTTLEPYRTPHLGILSSPRRYYTNVAGWQWAADNDCFQGLNPDAYLKMLYALEWPLGCLFVVVPDAVGDANRTDELWDQWNITVTKVCAQPLAYVAQDGCGEPPWGDLDCLFVGGTSEFKCGDQARELTLEAKRRGKWVHMGRVNTDQRMRLAESWGVDSIDGTSVSMYRDIHLLKRLTQAARPKQMGLHDA